MNFQLANQIVAIDYEDRRNKVASDHFTPLPRILPFPPQPCQLCQPASTLHQTGTLTTPTIGDTLHKSQVRARRLSSTSAGTQELHQPSLASRDDLTKSGAGEFGVASDSQPRTET